MITQLLGVPVMLCHKHHLQFGEERRKVSDFVHSCSLKYVKP